MRHRLDSPGWNAAVAAIISATDDQSTADAMIDAIGSTVGHEGTCLIAFHQDAGPEVLHHTLEPAGEKHYLGRYLGHRATSRVPASVSFAAASSS